MPVMLDAQLQCFWTMGWKCDAALLKLVDVLEASLV